MDLVGEPPRRVSEPPSRSRRRRRRVWHRIRSKRSCLKQKERFVLTGENECSHTAANALLPCKINGTANDEGATKIIYVPGYR